MSLTATTFMDTMATEMRITGRIFQETWGGLKRTGWMNVIIVVTMASILSIFGTLFSMVMETQIFVDNIGSGLRVSVYAAENTNLESLYDTIKGLDGVKAIEVITKEQAWQDMKQTFMVPDIENPLPNTLRVQMKDQKQIPETVSILEKLDGVEKVNYAAPVLEKIEKIAQITSAIGFAISIFFGLLTLFIISNTIHLLIEARSREIEILRMMGVGNWYIRLPFLLQGAAYGLAGSLLAYIPLYVVFVYIKKLMAFFQFSTDAYSLSVAFVTILLLGMVVGSAGAAVSVHRFLKV